MNQVPSDNENELDELGKFILLLDRLRVACGRPSLRELSRESRKVRELYGRRYPKLPGELSLTALSDVLGGRRKKPPMWNWVALYVLSCQRYGADSGVRPDPEDATLPAWNKRLQAVHRPDVPSPADEEILAEDDSGAGRTTPPAPGLGAPPSPAPGSPARDQPLSAPTHLDHAPRPPDGPLAKRDAPDGQEQDADHPADHLAEHLAEHQAGPTRAAITTVIELEAYADAAGPSLSEQRLFALYGQHGVQLLRRAEDRRDHDAEYRLGVLLCIDDRPKESLAWLLRAEEGGHAKARALIENPAPRRAALGHAWKLGSQDAGADYETATVYLERAARGGHAGAAFELGALHMEREDPERAAAWFAMAAECGHPLGEWWSDQNRQATDPYRPATAVPTVDELMTRLYGEPPNDPIR